jgi:hypothetical protein
MSVGLTTWTDASRKEDVVDLITNDYASTPFLSNIGESVANNTF